MFARYVSHVGGIVVRAKRFLGKAWKRQRKDFLVQRNRKILIETLDQRALLAVTNLSSSYVEWHGEQWWEGPVATFQSTTKAPTNLQATIKWDDIGSQPAAIRHLGGESFAVFAGRHFDEGIDVPYVVRLWDLDVATPTLHEASGTAQEFDAFVNLSPIRARPANLEIVEGVPFVGVVGSFVDTLDLNNHLPAGSYAVTIVGTQAGSTAIASTGVISKQNPTDRYWTITSLPLTFPIQGSATLTVDIVSTTSEPYSNSFEVPVIVQGATPVGIPNSALIAPLLEFDGKLGSFTINPGKLETIRSPRILVEWGDGNLDYVSANETPVGTNKANEFVQTVRSFDTGRLVELEVFGQHRYGAPGAYGVKVYLMEGNETIHKFDTLIDATPLPASGPTPDVGDLINWCNGNTTMLTPEGPLGDWKSFESTLQIEGVSHVTTVGVSTTFSFASHIGDSNGYVDSELWWPDQTEPEVVSGLQATRTFTKPGTYTLVGASYFERFGPAVLGDPDCAPVFQHRARSFRTGIHVQPLAFDIAATVMNNVALGAQVNATSLFTTSGSLNEFVIADVFWGDGSLSELEYTGSAWIARPGSSLSHVYVQPGVYRPSVVIRDPWQSKIAYTTINIPVPSTVALPPIELLSMGGEWTPGNPIAILIDKNPQHIGGSHLAVVEWGDGAKSEARMVRVGQTNQIRIESDHEYQLPGSYKVRLWYKDQLNEAVFQGTVNVGAPSINLTFDPIEVGIRQQLNNFVVAKIETAENSPIIPDRYVATVGWGDGSSSTGRIVPSEDGAAWIVADAYLDAADVATIGNGNLATQNIAKFDIAITLTDGLQTKQFFPTPAPPLGGGPTPPDIRVVEASAGDYQLVNGFQFTTVWEHWIEHCDGAPITVCYAEGGIDGTLGEGGNSGGGGGGSEPGGPGDPDPLDLPCPPLATCEPEEEEDEDNEDDPVKPSITTLGSAVSDSVISPNSSIPRNSVTLFVEKAPSRLPHTEEYLGTNPPIMIHGEAWFRTEGLNVDISGSSSTYNYTSSRQFSVAPASLRSQFQLPSIEAWAGQPMPANQAEINLAIFNTFTLDNYAYGSLEASIAWGDGTTSIETVIQKPDGSLAVPVRHTYSKVGVFRAALRIHSVNQPNHGQVFEFEVVSIDPKLVLTPVQYSLQAGEFGGTVAVAKIESNDWTKPWELSGEGFIARQNFVADRYFSTWVRTSLGEVDASILLLSDDSIEIHAKLPVFETTRSEKIDVVLTDAARRTIATVSTFEVLGLGWELDSFHRTNGMGEGQSWNTGILGVKSANLAIGTGDVQLRHQFDFDINPLANVGRNPELVYDSGTINVGPIIEATLANSLTGHVSPSVIQVRLRWNGKLTEWKSFAAAEGASDYSFAYKLAEQVSHSGLYSYELQTKITIPNALPVLMANEGTAQVIVRDNEPSGYLGGAFDEVSFWGLGWKLSTAERMIVQDNNDLLLSTAYGTRRWTLLGADRTIWENFRSNEQSPINLYPDEKSFTNGIGLVTYVPERGEFGTLQLNLSTLSINYLSKHQETRVYNHLGLLTNIQAKGHPMESLVYNDYGQLTAFHAMDSSITTFQYAGLYAATIIQPGSRPVQFNHSSGMLQSIQESSGFRSFAQGVDQKIHGTSWGVLGELFQYDSYGKVFKADQGSGTIHLLTPVVVKALGYQAISSNTLVSTVIDPKGIPHHFRVDKASRSERYEGPIALVKTWDRNDDHLVEEFQSNHGLSTFGYNNKGNNISQNLLGIQNHSYSFDPYFNFPSSHTAPDGRVTGYPVESVSGYTQADVDALGGTTTYQYGAGLLMSTVHINGSQTTNTYDGNRRRTSEAGPLGRNRNWTYDGFGSFRTYVDGTGAVTTSIYDAQNRLTQLTNAVGGVTSFSYAPSGLLIQKVDPNGRVTKYQYDQRAFLISTTEGTGLEARTTTNQYDAKGNLVLVTDPLGHATQHEYDARDRLVKTTDPMGGQTTHAYNHQDHRISTIDRAGRSWLYSYDTFGRMVSQVDPIGRTSTWTRNWRGDVLVETLPGGRITTNSYDSLYRLVSTSRNDRITHFQYDASSNLVTVVDPEGGATTYDYNALHQRTTMEDAMGGDWLYSYNTEGHLLSTVNPLLNTTSYTNDALGRPLIEVDQLGTAAAWTYNAMGSVASETNGRGHTTTFVYDIHNRRTSVIDPLGHAESFAYDRRDQLTKYTDKLGRETTYQYDGLGQRITETRPGTAMWEYSYDNQGNQISQRDPLSRLTIYEYDLVDRHVKTTNALGGFKTSQYDVANNLVLETDFNGRPTSHAYNVYGERTLTQDAAGGLTSWIYDKLGNVVSTVNARGAVTEIAYDAMSRPVETIDAMGGVWSNVYDAIGRMVESVDALGRSTTYSYNVRGHQILIVDPLNNETTFTVDGEGNNVIVVDPLGRMTTSIYDPLNRKISETDPMGYATTFTYNAGGNLVVRSRAGESTTFAYNAQNRPILVTTPDTGTTVNTYDIMQNLLTTTNNVGRQTVFAYDALYRQVSATSDSKTTTKTYDPVGNVLTVTTPLGFTTSYEYDALNRQTGTVDPLGGETTIEYSPTGHRTLLTDPVGNETVWTYDLLDRVTTVTDSLGNPTTYQYDAVGNQTSISKPNGNTIQRTFDALNRLTSQSSGSLVKQFSYDAVSQLVSAQQGALSSTFGYDLNGRMTSEATTLATGVSTLLSSSYDAKDNRLQLETKVNNVLDSVTDFTYGVGHRLTSLTRQSPTGPTVSIHFQRNGIGEQTNIERRYGTSVVATTEIAYDGSGRVVSWNNLGTGALVLNSYTQSFDADLRLTSRVTTQQGTDTWTYDSTNQVLSAVSSDGTSAAYDYDANGNRDGAGYVVGGDNRITSSPSGAILYDNNGNITERGNADGTKSLFVYDGFDRLTGVARQTATGQLLTKVEYGYDALDRRTSRKFDSNGDGQWDEVRYFVNDGMRQGQQSAGDELIAQLDASGSVTNRYIRGEDVDQVFSEESLGANGKFLWTVSDPQGSVVDLVQSNAGGSTLVNRVRYDSYGNKQSETDAAIGQLFGYTGREYDSAAGLQYNRARYYDPKLGRFISQDPIGFAAGDANLYRYVGNKPTMASDPSGLDELGGGSPLILNPTKEQLDQAHLAGIQRAQATLQEMQTDRFTMLLQSQRGLLENSAGLSTSQAQEYSDMELQLIAKYRGITLMRQDASQMRDEMWNQTMALVLRMQFDANRYGAVLRRLGETTNTSSWDPIVDAIAEYVDGIEQIRQNMITFGLSDAYGQTNTDEFQGYGWTGAKIGFGATREALIAAGTAGLGNVANAGRGGYLLHAALYAGRGYELYGTLESGYHSINQFQQGNYGSGTIFAGATVLSGSGFAGSFARNAPVSAATMGRRLPGTVVDGAGDVMLYGGRQQTRAHAIVSEAAQALGVDLSKYVDDVVVVSRNIHGDDITPWFSIVNGRRTIALTPQTLSRTRAGQLIDAAHEINHARHSQLLGASRYNAMYADPLMQARIEVLVQDRAIRAVQRHLGPINSRVLGAERGYINDWSMVYFEELFLWR